ncbi:MAG: hypothetical protein EOO45_09680 [Flavobacterium sp.]|nr:MAG: hypothetical protein EOO45_09680 [Flavobacterium sp.]
MKILKNIAVGFGISFIGSIPLGYLNVIGYAVYNRLGPAGLIWFILGVMSVEVIVIYLTLIFAKKLSKKRKLLRFIEMFSIFFMLLLAAIFYFSSGEKTDGDGTLDKYIQYSPYIIGVLLACVNFIQLPFWTGWNLYLLSGNYIVTGRYLKFYYIAGTLCGTFAGMLGFVYLLKLITHNSESISNNLTGIILPLIFLGLGIFQAYKYYRKYYLKKN